MKKEYAKTQVNNLRVRLELSEEDFTYVMNFVYVIHKIKHFAYQMFEDLYKGVIKKGEGILEPYGYVKDNDRNTLVYHLVMNSDITKDLELKSSIVGAVVNAIESDFKTDVKKGLFKWDIPRRSYKKNSPVEFRMKTKKIIQEKSSYYLPFFGKRKLKLHLGSDNYGIKEVLKRLSDPDDPLSLTTNQRLIYIPKSASITTGQKAGLYWMLQYEQPIKSIDTTNPVVAGIDLGLADTLVCVIKDTTKKLVIDGSAFLGKRRYYQRKKKQAQKNAAFNKGGHGRTRKMKGVEHWSAKETNALDAINKQSTTKLLKFLEENNVTLVQYEFLTKNMLVTKKDKILYRDWSVKTLLDYMIGKLQVNGIEMKSVDPYHTSQNCHHCGEQGTRIKKTFVCENPNCYMFHKKQDADINAAYNIAASTNYVTEYSQTEFAKFEKEKNKSKILVDFSE